MGLVRKLLLTFAIAFGGILLIAGAGLLIYLIGLLGLSATIQWSSLIAAIVIIAAALTALLITMLHIRGRKSEEQRTTEKWTRQLDAHVKHARQAVSYTHLTLPTNREV